MLDNCPICQKPINESYFYQDCINHFYFHYENKQIIRYIIYLPVFNDNLSTHEIYGLFGNKHSNTLSLALYKDFMIDIDSILDTKMFLYPESIKDLGQWNHLVQKLLKLKAFL